MKHFELKGWMAVGVTLAAAMSLILSVVLLTSGGGIEALGVSNLDTIQLEDGSATSPSVSFTSDTDNGLYRSSANVIGVAVGGSSVGTFSSSGWTGGVSVGSNDISGRNITATGIIYQDGVAFTGPLVAFSGVVTDGTTLAHTVGTTPTAVTCSIVNGGVLTESLYISATDATSVTFGIFDAAGTAGAVGRTVHCIATR